VPVTEIGLIPMPESLRTLTFIFFLKKSMTAPASLVPVRHSIPA
jgi:hypothetical protein